MIFQRLEYQKLYEAIESYPKFTAQTEDVLFRGDDAQRNRGKGRLQISAHSESIERAKEKIKKFYSAGGVFRFCEETSEGS